MADEVAPYTREELDGLRSFMASRVNLIESSNGKRNYAALKELDAIHDRLLATARAGLADSRRVEGLRREADAGGEIRINLMAGDVWEMDYANDEPEGFGSLNDLLDTLADRNDERPTPAQQEDRDGR